MCQVCCVLACLVSCDMCVCGATPSPVRVRDCVYAYMRALLYGYTTHVLCRGIPISTNPRPFILISSTRTCSPHVPAHDRSSHPLIPHALNPHAPAITLPHNVRTQSRVHTPLTPIVHPDTPPPPTCTQSAHNRTSRSHRPPDRVWTDTADR